MFPLVSFINHILAQHAWARERLVPHAGKTVRVDASPFTVTLEFKPNGEVQQVAERGAADIVFRVSPAQLPLFLGEPEAAMKAVRIEGDAELAQVVGSLMREVRWDAEEDLSRLVGDVPAFRAMQLLRSFTAWGSDASQRLAATTAAYLVDEQPTLVRSDMAEQFGRDVATLRDDFARLEKRLALLESPPLPRDA